MRKRFLPILLALCMALSLLPGNAVAADEVRVETPEATVTRTETEEGPAMEITLSCATEGATIYYVTGDFDEIDPVNHGQPYTEPFVAVMPVYLRAVAVKEGMENSLPLHVDYTMDGPGDEAAEAPEVSSAEPVRNEDGSYSMKVELSCQTEGASVYYTTDGGDPDDPYSGRMKYSGESFLVPVPGKLRAIALKPGMLTSSELCVEYTTDDIPPEERVARPAVTTEDVTLEDGSSAIRFTLSCTTEGATIYYVTDDLNEIDPVHNGQVYKEPFTAARPVYLRAVAVKEGMENSLSLHIDYTTTEGPVTETAETPQVSHNELVRNDDGTYSMRIELSCATEGATIYYTTDGADPDDPYSGRSIYNGPFMAPMPVQLRAIAFKHGMFTSERLHVDYSFGVAPPAVKAAMTTGQNNAFVFQLTCETEGAEIYYTTDGTEPAVNSTKYAGPFLMELPVTVKAIAVKGDDISGVLSRTFTKADWVETPTIKESLTDVDGAPGVTVTLSCRTDGAVIYYTDDCTDPVDTDTLKKYTGPFTLPMPATIRYIAVKGEVTSLGGETTYSNLNKVPTPKASPNGGRFDGSVRVTLSCETQYSVIYYTTDGSDPTRDSTEYTGPFVLNRTTTVKAFAVRQGVADSDILTVTFTRVSSEGGSSSGGSGSSGGGTGGSKPTPPTDENDKPLPPPDKPSTGPTVPVAHPDTTFRDSTAIAEVSEEMARQLVEDAVSGGSTEVVITPASEEGIKDTEVSIPGFAVGDLAEKTDASLKVETPLANVMIPNRALSDLSGQGDITISTKQSGNGMELEIKADGQRVDLVEGGLTVVIPEANCGPGTVAMLVYEDGTTEVIRQSFADGEAVSVPLDGSAKLVITDNSKSFSDVSDDSWAKDAVRFASSHELFNGVSPDTFAPDTAMTRGMLAQVLHNLVSNPDTEYGGTFSDVSSHAWYADAVQWAADSGIITGYPDGSFAPEQEISREQLVVMLYRYAGNPELPGRDKSFTDFSDAHEVSDWAQDAMEWAVQSGIINGKGELLAAQHSATRAEVAQVLLNFMSEGFR